MLTHRRPSRYRPASTAPDCKLRATARRGGDADEPGSESGRYRWRQGLHVDSDDVIDKALRHRRFDLFYGPYYLRFTRSLEDGGRTRLRLEELARLVDAGPGARGFAQPAGPRPGSFLKRCCPALQQVAPGRSLRTRGRLFFERAAHLLDDSAAVSLRPPRRNASSA